jgi:uncharacterized protein (DUF1778 family)
VTKTARLDLRLTADQKTLIEQAAAIEGATAAGFAITTLVERAAETVYRARIAILPAEAWEEFVRTLDEQPELPAATRALLSEPTAPREGTP